MIASGTNIQVSTQSVGTHTITASVTDLGELSGGDTISVTVSAADGISVDSLTPSEISRGTTTRVTIAGSGFEGGLVSVENGSGPTPELSIVNVVDGVEIIVDVYVKNSGPPRLNTWDVRVTNPGGASDVLPVFYPNTPAPPADGGTRAYMVFA